MTNCPNCDAVLSYEGGLHCDYCGARFERPEAEPSLDIARFYSNGELVMTLYSPQVDEGAV